MRAPSRAGARASVAVGSVVVASLAAPACESDVVRSQPPVERLPCTAAVVAEIVTSVDEQGTVDDLVAIDGGWVLATSTLRRDRATLVRLSSALVPEWTVELPTTLEERDFDSPGTRIAAAGGEAVVVASVAPGDGASGPHLEVRRLEGDGSTAWAAAVADTPHHAPVHLAHRSGEATVLFNDFPPRGLPEPPTYEIARVGDDGAILERRVVAAAETRPMYVRRFDVDDDGRLVVGGRRSPQGADSFGFLAAFEPDGSPAWTWVDERLDHFRPLPFARVDGSWLVAVGDRDAEDGAPGVVVIDDEGRVTSTRSLEPFSPATRGARAGRSLDVVLGSGGGGAFVAGSLRSNDQNEVVLLRVEADGSRRWRVELDDELFRVRSMVELPDGGVVVAGFQHDGSRGGDSVIRLWRTDAGGRLQWTHDVHGVPGEALGPIVLPGDDGSLVVAASVVFAGEGRTTVQQLRESCTD